MDDFISRDYAVENMENFPWDTEHDKNAAIHLVRELVPAADVRPVVKARWYWDNYKYDWCCSNCFHPADHSIDKDDTYKKPSFKFCPHCGAMTGDNLDTTKGDNHD